MTKTKQLIDNILMWCVLTIERLPLQAVDSGQVETTKAVMTRVRYEIRWNVVLDMGQRGNEQDIYIYSQSAAILSGACDERSRAWALEE